jgi:hypothetical protein
VQRIEQPIKEFWDRWVRYIFPSLLKQNKWYKYRRKMQVGDIMLRMDETAAG